MRAWGSITIVVVLCACSSAAPQPGGDSVPQPQEPEAPVSVGPDPWQAAQARGIEFRALGQEPGWYLEIDEGTSMRLVYDYADREATIPVPMPTIAEGTTTYDAKTDEHHLRVVIEDKPCSDVMSGLRFRRTVTVTIDGNTYRGCGREL